MVEQNNNDVECVMVKKSNQDIENRFEHNVRTVL